MNIKPEDALTTIILQLDLSARQTCISYIQILQQALRERKELHYENLKLKSDITILKQQMESIKADAFVIPEEKGKKKNEK